MRFMTLVLALTLPSGHVAAQNVNSEYAAAFKNFTLPEVDALTSDSILDDDPLEKILPTLADTWVPAWEVSPRPDLLYYAVLAEACRGPAAFTLVPTARRSFEMRHPPAQNGATLTVRYDYIIGNAFQRSVNERDLLAYMGFEDPDEIPIGTF